MMRITDDRLFELYLDTLEMCKEDTKLLPDEWIEHDIFEEFIVGITSFFSLASLDRLFDNGLIDEQIYNDSKQLRNLTLKLDNTKQWNVVSFKKSESWDEIILLSDKIKNEIKNRLINHNE